MHGEQISDLALAEAVAQPQAQQKQVPIRERGEPVAGRVAEDVVPARVGFGRERSVFEKVVVAQGFGACLAAAQERDLPVLENTDEPGNERSLAIVAGEDGYRARRLGDDEVAPEVLDRRLASLFVARKEAQ